MFVEGVKVVNAFGSDGQVVVQRDAAPNNVVRLSSGIPRLQLQI